MKTWRSRTGWYEKGRVIKNYEKCTARTSDGEELFEKSQTEYLKGKINEINSRSSTNRST